MKLATMIMACVAVLMLSACGHEDSASYLIDGPRHSLSLLRDKPFLWSSGWDLTLVTTNQPDCLRRGKLDHAGDDDFKAELYRTYDGAYIFRHEKNWFVTETQKCQLQQFKTPPPAPGELLGTFEEKDGTLKFISATEAAANSSGRAGKSRTAQ